MALLFLTAAFGVVVQAVAFESTVAQPTDVSIPHQTIQKAEVTTPPNPSAVRELLRRAEAQTVLVGPDNTCGYVSGSFGAAYTCQVTTGYCALLTTAGLGAVACCGASGCDFITDCRDAEQVDAGICNAACMNDIYTAKCTASSAPYCGTVRFLNSITDYFCHSLSYSTVMDVLTTYSGETDSRSYSELVITLTDSSSSRITSARASGSATRSASSGTATSDTGSLGGSSSDSSGGSSSSSGSSSSGGSGGGSSAPIGAIVGGVVGGVAVLALIGLGIWLISRRNRRNKAAAASAAGYPPAQQYPTPGAPSPGPGAAAAGHQSVYNPPYPQQQYPSPQGYQQPQGAGYFPNQEKPVEPYAVGHAPVQPSSPMSQATDPRYSLQPSSPTSTMNSFQPQHTGNTYQTQSPNVPSTVYEAGGDAVGTQGPNANHRGQFHELS
ncbi:hypothetical protein BKA67DRAFT_195378 [Truncatella angustata]|uniref:Uncharacterized protein n=1 Tax=Truncatella angustata TaxID=152316 RepID=A0A9P8URJ6_9PEZI|nr:uncharacterized protein BKA67DRAFT_195378 [Truncatella angustata]KAH6657685.1 hypothetical protein BKA67DRAFT_195378 [Truncatella angustata]